MTRYKIAIEYKGSAFSGWQRQLGIISVQQVIEEAIESFTGKTTKIFGSGRTDAGVHALNQVAHFDLELELPCYKVMTAINHFVKPNPVVVYECSIVEDDFHARFSAKSREYVYRILNRNQPSAIYDELAWHVAKPLDAEAMHLAGQCLIGKHDFSAFRSTHCQSHSPIKNLTSLIVKRTDDWVEIHISAPSFMHNQVRIITGCLVKVGTGSWPVEKVQQILASRDRKLAAATAPAHGLYLSKIKY